jgi:CheY-like chemotaxis protein
LSHLSLPAQGATIVGVPVLCTLSILLWIGDLPNSLWCMLAVLVAALVSATASAVFAGGIARRLGRIEENAARFSRGEATKPVDGGSDAIGRLEEALLATIPQALARERARMADKVSVAVSTKLAAAEENGEVGTSPRHQAHILLVEDSEASVALVQAYLEGTGCTSEWVADGAAALGRLTDGGPGFSLVLMDVQMPKLDGYDATSQFRAWERSNGRPRTPVVALTAHAFQEDVDRAIKAGADGHLTKPIRRETLLEAVEWYERGPDTPELRVDVPDYIRELAPEFLRRQRLGLFAAVSALRRGDFATMQTFAHNMKGCGRSFGFPHLTELGRDMERAAKDHDAGSLGRQAEELREYLTAVEIA